MSQSDIQAAFVKEFGERPKKAHWPQKKSIEQISWDFAQSGYLAGHASRNEEVARLTAQQQGVEPVGYMQDLNPSWGTVGFMFSPIAFYRDDAKGYSVPLYTKPAAQSADEAARITKERDEFARDARRYRFLVKGGIQADVILSDMYGDPFAPPSEIDAAIDAAIAKQEGKP